MEVDIFVPCFVDQFYPDTAFNMVKVLEKAGVSVNYNPKQTCCGQPAFNSGYWKESLAVAKKLIRDFPGDRLIVAPSASCTGFIRNYYKELDDNAEYKEACASLSGRLFEFTDFLVNKIGVTDFISVFEAKVTWHDACSALREYGIKDEPRKLLANVKGLELLEMERNDVCCGFGGTFSVKNEPISTAMADNKVEDAIASGAEYLSSTEASCLMHLDGYIKKQKLPIKTIHIADILASGI